MTRGWLGGGLGTTLLCGVVAAGIVAYALLGFTLGARWLPIFAREAGAAGD